MLASIKQGMLCLAVLAALVLQAGFGLAAEVAPLPNGQHFTLDTPPAEVLRGIPSLSQLAEIVDGGWGETWQEASILADDARGSVKLTTRYVVATQNMLMALRASLDTYSSSTSSDPEVLLDYERTGREFYWGHRGQALERIEFRAYTVPQSRLEEAQKISENPKVNLEQKRAALAKMTRSYDRVYWFDISAPFKHNSQIIWRMGKQEEK